MPMSEDEQMTGGPVEASVEETKSHADKPKYKSWRKKYRKMKAHFDEVLKENNASFVEEQKLEALCKRLQEHNDQIADMLLDLNNSLHIPASLRYDVSIPNPAVDRHDDLDVDTMKYEIQNLHSMLEAGNCPPPEYHQSRCELEENLARRGVRKLVDLEKKVPTPLSNKEDLVDVSLQPEFLTTDAEYAYLLAIDAAQGDQWSLSQTLPPPPVKFSEMTTRELEREIELRNPHSVHSWLKKHKSEQEQLAEDAASEAALATPATGRKRGTNLAKKMGDKAVNRARQSNVADVDGGSPASIARGDIDGVDDEIDDSILLSASARKKGGDKDDTYRPKGGRSKGKRKRDTEGGENGKGKKARTSMPATIAAAPEV